MALQAFHVSTTKRFNITVTLNGVAPDITGDTVQLVLRSDGSTPVTATFDADVASLGASGVAMFHLTPEQTAIAALAYKYEIVWNRDNGDDAETKPHLDGNYSRSVTISSCLPSR